jgi:hypothetical protein
MEWQCEGCDFWQHWTTEELHVVMFHFVVLDSNRLDGMHRKGIKNDDVRDASL